MSPRSIPRTVAGFGSRSENTGRTPPPWTSEAGPRAYSPVAPYTAATTRHAVDQRRRQRHPGRRHVVTPVHPQNQHHVYRCDVRTVSHGARPAASSTACAGRPASRPIAPASSPARPVAQAGARGAGRVSDQLSNPLALRDGAMVARSVSVQVLFAESKGTHHGLDFGQPTTYCIEHTFE
jgi:hypothetical protein